MRFEWDTEKAARNERLHGVSFEEARELFTTEAPVLEVYDVEHSDAEDRFKSIGPIHRGLVLVVWSVQKISFESSALGGPRNTNKNCTSSTWRVFDDG